MASIAAMTAFEDRLAQWPSIQACPFVDANEVSDVPRPPYVRIEYPVANEDRMTRGSQVVYRESGGARLVLTVGAFDDGWKAQLFGWVEELRDLFRNKRFGGVETAEVSPPVLDDRNRDQNKYSVGFVILYHFDIVR